MTQLPLYNTVPFMDDDFYDGPSACRYNRIIRTKYMGLMTHGHREFEGLRRGDPLPFSLLDFKIKVKAAIRRGQCYHCNGTLNEDNFSPDHMTALSVGGTSDLSNIRIICWFCNKQKGSMSDLKFHNEMRYMRLILAK